MPFRLRVHRFGVALGLAALATGCAHSPARAPAFADVSRTSYEAEVNPQGKAGAYRVDFHGHFPLRHDLTFAHVVDLFRGVEVSNAIGARLAKLKPHPLNMLRAETEMTGEGGGRLVYVVTGYVNNLRLLTASRSKVVCTDDLRARSWKQECRAEMAYRETAKYMEAYSQSFDCVEQSGAADCRLRVEGTMKAIRVPKVAKALLGAEDFSATQAAYRTAENMLHSFHAFAKILEQAPPLAARAQAAVSAYHGSEAYSAAAAVGAKMPASLDSTASARFR